MTYSGTGHTWWGNMCGQLQLGATESNGRLCWSNIGTRSNRCWGGRSWSCLSWGQANRGATGVAATLTGGNERGQQEVEVAGHGGDMKGSKSPVPHVETESFGIAINVFTMEIHFTNIPRQLLLFGRNCRSHSFMHIFFIHSLHVFGRKISITVNVSQLTLSSVFIYSVYSAPSASLLSSCHSSVLSTWPFRPLLYIGNSIIAICPVYGMK